MDEETERAIAILAAAQAQTAGQAQAVLFAVAALCQVAAGPALQQALQQNFERHYASMLASAWPEQMNQAFDQARQYLETAAGSPGAP